APATTIASDALPVHVSGGKTDGSTEWRKRGPGRVALGRRPQVPTTEELVRGCEDSAGSMWPFREDQGFDNDGDRAGGGDEGADVDIVELFELDTIDGNNW